MAIRQYSLSSGDDGIPWRKRHLNDTVSLWTCVGGLKANPT
jgi:hypothetical protein